MNSEPIEGIQARLQDAALDPSLWPDLLTAISKSVDGAGALILSTDRRWKVAPCSPDLTEMHEAYFEGGWHEVDSRYRGLPLMVANGVVTDPEFISDDEIKRTSFYRDFLEHHGRRWFGGLGFFAGDDFWCLSVQRATDKGPFQKDEIKRLRALWRPFGDAATLSRIVGRTWIDGVAHGLDTIGHAAFVCDKFGTILDINDAALGFLREDVGRNRQLDFADSAANEAYLGLLASARRAPTFELTQPAVCRLVLAQQTLLLRAIRLDGHAKLLFSDAALLVLIKPEHPSPETIMKRTFGLTNAETRVALALVSGTAVATISQMFMVKPDTIRTQLKAVYSKTQTNGQAQLVALLARLTQRHGDPDDTEI